MMSTRKDWLISRNVGPLDDVELLLKDARIVTNEVAEELTTLSYYRMFDLTNREGISGEILSKTRKFAEWESARSSLRFHTYRRVLLSAPDRTVIAKDPFDYNKPKEYVFFGGNGYLNLSTHPEVIDGAQTALSAWGTSSGASSIIGGKSAFHEETEEKLARFLGMEASFIFPSGYTANDSTITALARPGDVIFGDNANHLSIDLPSSSLQSMSSGRIKYQKLSPMIPLIEQLRAESGNKILITDGVFSMDGTTADLAAIKQSCRETDTFLIVDDAHGVGVLGERGAGTSEHYGIKPDMITGSCAKALGSMGGFAAGSRDAIRFIEGTSTGAIYSTYQASSTLGAVSAALDLIAREPERREKLVSNANYLKRRLVSIGASTSNTRTAIVPVLLESNDQAWYFSYYLHKNQIYANTIFPPAVKQPRIRFSVCTNHTKEDLDRVVDVTEQCLASYETEFALKGMTFIPKGKR